MNTYAQHIRAWIFVNETFIKFKSNIKSHTLTVGDFNTQLLPMGRTNQQKFNREIRELTDVMTQMDLTDIYQTFHTNTKNIPSSQHIMEPSLKLNTYSGIRKITEDTKK